MDTFHLRGSITSARRRHGRRRHLGAVGMWALDLHICPGGEFRDTCDPFTKPLQAPRVPGQTRRMLNTPGSDPKLSHMTALVSWIAPPIPSSLLEAEEAWLPPLSDAGHDDVGGGLGGHASFADEFRKGAQDRQGVWN